MSENTPLLAELAAGATDTNTLIATARAREYANHEIQNGRHNEQWFSNGIIEVKIRRTAIPERPFALVNHQRSFHKTVDKLFFP